MELTHVNDRGEARMVDVSGKDATHRRAVAGATVTMSAATLAQVVEGTIPKGDVLAAARIAGIMAAKQTASLIPLCHPLPLSSVTVDLTPVEHPPAIVIRATAATTAPTGVEMEAMTAAAVAGLTLYDMVKGVEKGVTITGIVLLEKEGGKSGHYRRGES